MLASSIGGCSDSAFHLCSIHLVLPLCRVKVLIANINHFLSSLHFSRPTDHAGFSNQFTTKGRMDGSPPSGAGILKSSLHVLIVVWMGKGEVCSSQDQKTLIITSDSNNDVMWTWCLPRHYSRAVKDVSYVSK